VHLNLHEESSFGFRVINAERQLLGDSKLHNSLRSNPRNEMMRFLHRIAQETDALQSCPLPQDFEMQPPSKQVRPPASACTCLC
jgi:hypothetical protein